jgi:hypothetical protein
MPGRRGFLATLGALAAAPFVRQAKAEPYEHSLGGYVSRPSRPFKATLHGQEYGVPIRALQSQLDSFTKEFPKTIVLKLGMAVALAFLWTQCALAGVADPPVKRGFVIEQTCYRDGVKVECPKFSLQLRGGLLGGKAADIDIRPLPAFAIRAGIDLTSLEGGPVGQVDVELTGLPNDGGGELDLEEPATSVKAFDASFAVIQPLGRVLRFNLYARAGLASRLVASSDPALRLPGYASFGFDVHSADGDHWLQVGLGPDQRLSGEWVPTVQVLAGLCVKELHDAKFWLVGGFIRALDLSAYGYKPPARDWWTVSGQAGWGKR